MANAQRTAANQVVIIANVPALNSNVAVYTGGTWSDVYSALNAALTGTTTQAEITTLRSAITAITAVATPSTGYSAPQMMLMLGQLLAAVDSWDALIPA
jgi:hypothetical protein